MTDTQKVALAIDQAEAEDREIDDACARVIASWWADGSDTVSYGFASTGAIQGSGVEVYRALVPDGAYDQQSAEDRRALDWLGTYLLNREERGPVTGWSDLWL